MNPELNGEGAQGRVVAFCGKSGVVLHSSFEKIARAPKMGLMRKLAWRWLKRGNVGRGGKIKIPIVITIGKIEK